MLCENFKNRKPELVYIPETETESNCWIFCWKQSLRALDGVTNSQVDETGTTKPLLECITSGVIRGAVAMVGCNNPKIRPDSAHIELMKKLYRKRYRDHRFRMFRTGSCKSWPYGQIRQEISAVLV